VTFAYRAKHAGRDGEDTKDHQAISAVEFNRRYLQHVMPKGLGRAQSYGWWSVRQGRPGE